VWRSGFFYFWNGVFWRACGNGLKTSLFGHHEKRTVEFLIQKSDFELLHLRRSREIWIVRLKTGHNFDFKIAAIDSLFAAHRASDIPLGPTLSSCAALFERSR
jgi:hypothetical protein